MAKNNNLTDFLKDLSDTLRAQTNTEDLINPQDFSDQIGALAIQSFNDGITEGYTGGYSYGYGQGRDNFINSITDGGTNFNSFYGYGYKSGYGGNLTAAANLTELPFIDTSNGTTFRYMYTGCKALLVPPLTDLHNGTDFTAMFQSCSALTSVPDLDLSSGTTFTYMFRFCSSLRSVPALDTSKGTNLNYMFYGCSTLHTIGGISFSSATTLTNVFSGCTLLQNITFAPGSVIAATITLQASTLLTNTSIRNIIAALAPAPTSGLTVTLSLTAVNNAFKTSAELVDGSTSSEWATLIATKTNWTFALV